MSRRASGFRAWVVQRLSGIFLALFGTYVVLHFAFDAPADHAAFKAWVASPWVSLGLLMSILPLMAHAWVGTRDVFIDYLRPTLLRVTALSLMAFVFLASGLWAAQAIIIARIAA